jgi:hypothetical protein
MAWTDPKTWTAGELVTETMLNTYIRDNDNYLYDQIKYVEFEVFGTTTDWSTGDGKKYFHVPADLNGMNLVEVHALAITAGTTSVSTIQVANVTDAVDMLSTRITIDSGETGSNTAATPPVINTATDDIATNDVLRIDIDTVSSTPPKGLIVTLGFQRI